MSAVRMVSEPNASPQEAQVIEDKINEFNMTVTGDRNWKPVRIFLRADDGSLRGGITANLWGGWMHVDYLWVDQDLRKEGFGSQLVLAAEAEALAYGCHDAWLETYSFQAKPFYEKLGYEVIAEMTDFPPGHSHYVLKKHLG